MTPSKKQLIKPIGRANFPDLEKEILGFWKTSDILEKSLEQNKNNKIKAFYDGPITANGMPHHGHMLTFAMKDLYPRYWTMSGYYVPRSLGWDCQGIPVEYEIEKKLGFTQKKDIEIYGIAAFNRLCRESVLEYRGTMIDLEERMGRLTNTDEEYATMDANYIESLWWSIKELYTKDLLYEGFKVVPYSTRAGTTLSNAEVALGGYKTITDQAVTVKFELENEPGTFVLAWTTTPWTLPTNFALAIGRDIEYVKVKSTQNSNETYIVAKERLDYVFGEGHYTIISEVSGSQLIGQKYKPLFDFFVGRDNCFEIYEGFHVTTDSGTGVVHLAPYGAEDNEIFQKVGIESVDVLDSQGDFGEQVKPYTGMNYQDANPLILDDLKTHNALFKVEDYDHEMPMCWRTNTPLIYKPIVSWYIAVSKMRSELVANNEQITWAPGHAKHGRFGNWLSDIKDWGISRLRYWGTPLPIWKAPSGKTIIIGSFAELKSYAGDDIDISDPHRPFVDDITFEFEGELYTRIPDVIDVWYDSGAMPFARFHYPFENKEKFSSRFPAEFISEGVDQTRGWFYTLHALGTTLFNSPAFTNVIMSGFVLDDKGAKLSKSKKNYSSPDSMLENFGADTIRLNFFSTPITMGEDTTMSDKTLKLITQEYMLPLWNLLTYVTTYAELHDWNPNSMLILDSFVGHTNATIMDTWLIARLHQTIQQTRSYLDQFQTQKALESIKSLMDDFSKWYIRRSRDRFVDGDDAVMATSYHVLVTIAKLLAPFAPFVSEAMYNQLVKNVFDTCPESIHLNSYPVANTTIIDSSAELLAQMESLRDLSSLGQKLRSNSGIKLRQPLAKCFVSTPLSEEILLILAEELNTKSAIFQTTINATPTLLVEENNGLAVGLDIQLTPELEAEGLVREIVRNIQNTRKNNGFQFGQLATLGLYSADAKIQQFIEQNKEDIMQQTFLSTINIEQDPLGDEVKINEYKAHLNLL